MPLQMSINEKGLMNWKGHWVDRKIFLSFAEQLIRWAWNLCFFLLDDDSVLHASENSSSNLVVENFQQSKSVVAEDTNKV